MQEQIINFFTNISAQDYIIFIISVWFFVMFIFAGIEKIYKAYLWIIIWLFIFTMVNLTINSLNDNDIWVNWLRDFIINHREWFGFYSILFIPILAILLPLNKNISFRVSKKKAINYFVTFLFWIFFFSFLFTIFLSIINNRFLFSMDNSIITKVRESYLINLIYEYFSPSYIFNFLINYDYLINLFIIVFIFYKMTIGWVVDYLMAKLLRFLVNFFEEKSKWWPKESHHEKHDDEHWDEHDTHQDHAYTWHWHH